MVEDPHLNARGFWAEVDHISAGPHKLAGLAWNMDRTPGAVYSASPALGQYNDYVLKEILGKSEEEVQRLRDAGVLETTPELVLQARAAAEAKANG